MTLKTFATYQALEIEGVAFCLGSEIHVRLDGPSAKATGRETIPYSELENASTGLMATPVVSLFDTVVSDVDFFSKVS